MDHKETDTQTPVPAFTVNFSPAICHWDNIRLPLLEK